jgi:hypothetical protein
VRPLTSDDLCGFSREDRGPEKATGPPRPPSLKPTAFVLVVVPAQNLNVAHLVLMRLTAAATPRDDVVDLDASWSAAIRCYM